MIDFSTVKKIIIPEGVVTKIVAAGKTLWQAITFTNQVPISIDTDGSIFNGVGYIDNRRLSSSGGLSSSAQNGTTTSGFIPWHGDGDVIRMKGVEFYGINHAQTSLWLYIIFYDANKKYLQHMDSSITVNSSYSHIVSASRDANGVETIEWSHTYGDTNSWLNAVRAAKFMRMTVKGKGADWILTINEEIA